MAVNIEFTLEGVGTIKRRINKISKSINDFTPAWKKIGEDFRDTEEKVFKGQGSYGSRSKWVPLTPKYQAWKSSRFPGRPILQMSGDLKNSLTTKGKNSIEIIRPKSITLGSSDPKYVYHQRGTKRGLPARPPITFTRYQGDKWVKIIKETILKGI